jgi:urea transport system ATP-binding protein
MLCVKNLSVSYDGSRILRSVTLQIPERSLVCLMGRNGVGKTTTLKAVLGLVRPDTGDIELDQQSLNSLKPEARALKGLGYVPQGRDIFPNLTVWENLKISLVVHGAKANGQVDRVLAVSGVERDAPAKRRGFEWRTATTTCDRAGPANRSQSVDSGRAYRRNSAKCHRSDWGNAHKN